MGIKNQYKRISKGLDICLFERKIIPPFQNSYNEYVIMGEPDDFEKCLIELENQHQQFIDFGKASRILKLRSPWQFRNAFHQSKFEEMFWNNRKMKLLFFAELKLVIESDRQKPEIQNLLHQISVTISEAEFLNMQDCFKHRASGAITGMSCLHEVGNQGFILESAPLGDWYGAE